jgi:cobalt transporter subunit CbtB
MAAAPDTVHDRLEYTQSTLTPPQIATGLLLIGALGFALLFVQEPLVHDSMHNFRHAAGITCH